MPEIYSTQQIKEAVNLQKNWQALLAAQRQAFNDFSKGLMRVPPPLLMHFEEANGDCEGEYQGDCHVKAGFKRDGAIFVVKIATGFYKNTKINLPPGDGAMLVLCQKTGLLQAILLDSGYLTTLRTAMAACIVAKVTPWEIQHIGIGGTGQLAAQLLELFHLCYPNAAFSLWGRSLEKAKALAAPYPNIKVCTSIEEIIQKCDLVITATANASPIIKPEQISRRTHIIALGADELGKQECDPNLFQLADVVIVDSKEQAQRFGDAFYAVKSGLICAEKLQELGDVLETGAPDTNLMISDFTGIAAQDIAIAELALTFLKKEKIDD